MRDQCNMTEHELRVYEWALNQQHRMMSARYAYILAEYIKRAELDKKVSSLPICKGCNTNDKVRRDDMFTCGRCGLTF